MNIKHLATGVMALLALVSGFFYFRTHDGADAQIAFSLNGNVDVRQVELGFRVAGRIAELAIEEGQSVEPGQLLARLDKAPFEHEAAAAKANLAAAQALLDKALRGNRSEEIAQARATVTQRQADLANAQITAGRLQELLTKGLVTRQQVDDANARVYESEAALDAARQQLQLVQKGPRIEDINAQQASVEAAKAQLAKAQTALMDTELYAPSKGVVSVRARELGAIVSAGQTVLTVALTDPVWIRAYVSQPRLGSIKPGMQVNIAVDSMPGKQYQGKVGFISPEAEFTPKSVQTEQVRDDLVYRIRVIADDPDRVFRQGMPVTITVTEAQSAASSSL